ncbi:MAG TPA: hypothetical protein VKQ52_06815, partial [Puia sp.]|nr:hypothetical protein [Puia sp.]
MIYPVMNELDQTFRVDARFTGVSMPAFIHSSAEANIIIQRKANSLVLPRSALAGNDSVWVRESGGERKVRVRLGISTPDDVEILAGINEQTAVRAVPKSAAP